MLNTRVGVLPDSTSSTRPYRPIAVSTNALRSAINLQSILSVACTTNAEIFECVAEPASRSRSRFMKLCNLDDTATGRIPLKLLYYFGMPVIIAKNSSDPDLTSIVANGTIGHVVGHHLGQSNPTHKVFEGVDILSHTSVPDALLVKFLHSTTTYDPQLPRGVIALKPFRGKIDISIPNAAGSSLSMTIKQFALVPAFALTPEKLQEQTCKDGLTILNLHRDRGTSPQILYVAFSRSVSLDKLTLTVPLTRPYLDQFRPRNDTLAEVRRLIELVVFPEYAQAVHREEFASWKTHQFAV